MSNKTQQMSDLHSSNAVDTDRRRRKSQAAIQHAFSRLFIERGFDGFSVGDIVEQADVARSTFYQYYTGKEEVLGVAIAPLLSPIADCVTSEHVPDKLLMICEHFWANRRFAHSLFASPSQIVVGRLLADLIEERRLRLARAGSIERLVAKTLAQTALNMLEEWFSGKYRCKPQTLANLLHAALFGTSRELAKVSASNDNLRD